MAVLLPVVGIVLGIIVMAKGRLQSGAVAIVLAVAMVFVWTLILSALGV